MLYQFTDIQGNKQSVDAVDERRAISYAQTKGVNNVEPVSNSSTPAPVKTSPLTSITTENAAGTLDKNLGKLNSYSPTTDPNYTQPTAKTEKTSNAAVASPKAFFTNENGQEAEYTQDQLNDPKNQKFLQDSGFVMTKTEGPTLQASQLSNVDKQINDLIEKFNSYSINTDPSFAAEASSITSQYDELRNEIAQQKEQFGRDFDVLAIREGVSRYTPERATNIRAGVAMEATQALGSILRKEQQSISEARKAYASGKYTEFNNQINALEKIRDDKSATLKELNKTIADSLEETRKETKRMTMESNISDLLNDGMTDPRKISEALGFQYSSKDISDTLKNLSPQSDLDKLSGETKNFYILKSQGQLPPSITNLPENRQLFSYLAQKAAVERAPKDGTSGSKITLTDIKSFGLPISAFGMSDQEVIGDLQKNTPPPWFIEKISNQLKMSVLPDSKETVDAWNEYRDTTLNTVEEGKAKDDTNYTKSHQYFSATYDGLTSEELDHMATEVMTYVNGGMSYADAITQVEDDNK